MLTSSDQQGRDFVISTTDDDFDKAPFVKIIEKGDLNRDGCVDTVDLGEFIEVMRGRASKLPSILYDLNSDSEINIADARALVVAFSKPRGASCEFQ